MNLEQIAVQAAARVKSTSTIILWKYHKTHGDWEKQRDCSKEEADQWLKHFEKDEPKEFFRLSEKKPKTNPYDDKPIPKLPKYGR